MGSCHIYIFIEEELTISQADNFFNPYWVVDLFSENSQKKRIYSNKFIKDGWKSNKTWGVLVV